MSNHPWAVATPLMSDPNGHWVQSPGADTACSTLAGLAVLGGLVAGTTAAAANLRQVRTGALDTGPALIATARTATIGAAATAVAGAVAGAVAQQGLLRLGLMLAVGTAVVYGLEQWGRDHPVDEDREGPHD